MIIVRSPLRISLGGGGTDLSSYYLDHGGFVISAAINKYIYTTVNKSFRDRITLKYSQIEDVETVDEIKHPVIREALKLLKITGSIDIDTISDIPQGTGMGSSGTFTTGLLQALHMYKRETLTKRELAEEAYHIEHDILGQHCGKQDQYIAAVGGVTVFRFRDHNFVDFRPLRINQETLANLEEGLLLFFTGYTRSSAELLADQDIRSKNDDGEMIDNLHITKYLGEQTANALEAGNLHKFAELMNDHWAHKRSRSKGMTNDRIDRLYEWARANGALSGKVVGAGGGGFLLFYAEDKVRLRKAMLAQGLREVRFQFDFEGTSTMVHS